MAELRLSVILFFGLAASSAANWDSVNAVLFSEIKNQTFPGAVALVGNESAVMYQNAVGNFTYGLPAPSTGSNAPMAIDTPFDLASLTKVNTLWSH